MAIRKTGWFIVAVAAMFAGGAFGYVITDTTGWMLNTNTAEEAGGCTSLDNSGDNTVSLWSDGAFPVAGKKYLVRTARLRAPTKTTAADKLWRFAGDTLAIDGSDVTFLTSEKTIKYYLGDMRWHTGGITSWNQAQINIQGNISVDTGAGADVFTITGRNQTFDIWSSMTGEEGRARIKIISENGGKHKVPGDNFGRTTVCFRGDTSQLHAAITLTTNTTLSAAGALSATITAPPSGEVTSAAAASYNAVTLQSGASLIVSSTNTLTVGNLTLNTGSHLVWEMSEDNSLGKLIVTGTIAGSGAEKLTLELRNLTFSTNSVTTFDLLKIPTGTGFSESDIELVGNVGTYANVPVLYDMSLVSEGADWMVYRVKVKPLVMHVRNDGNDYKTDDHKDGPFGTSFTNAASWSDHALPHANAVYRTPFSKNASWYLRASEDPDCYPEFQGDALVLDYRGYLALRSSLKVDQLTLLENSRICMSDVSTVELSGHILIPEGVTNVSVEAYNKKVQTISSDISGVGVFKVDGRSTSGTPCGTVRLTGDNSGFRGRILVTIKTVAGKCPTLAAGRHGILRIAAANNLGGALDAFTWNALALEQLSDLQVTDDVSIEGASNRGVSISWDAAITVSDGKTFTVNTPVTYAGRLRKCGTGTLALGAKPRFIDGQEGTAPLAGTNVLDVTAGALMPLSADSLEGVAVTFTNNTRWVVSAAQTGDFAQYGVLCTNDVGGISTVATDEKIDVTVTDVVAAAKPQHEAALCTLPTHESADELRNKLRVAKPCPRVRLSTYVRDNADSSATVVVRADTAGMLLIFR